MRHANGAGTGDLTIAGPLSKDVNCVDALDISQEISASQALDYRARHGAALQTLGVLAELFPAAFVAERWKPHKPLKIGIHQDLVDRGVLLPSECRAVFSQYCSRLMYLRALAGGGPRFDVDGNPAGEVTPAEIKYAQAFVAHLEAKAIAKAEAARQEAENKRIARRASKQPSPPPSTAPPSEAPRRVGIADLKRAAVARRNGGAS
jgi:sRNA-binding protein